MLYSAIPGILLYFSYNVFVRAIAIRLLPWYVIANYIMFHMTYTQRHLMQRRISLKKK